MSPRLGEDGWDFTSVIGLIDSLSIKCNDYVQKKTYTPTAISKEQVPPNTKGNGPDEGAQLGNFDKIWQYLGQPLSIPPPPVPPRPRTEFVHILEKTGSNDLSPLQAVKWRDELEGADLAGNDEVDDTSGLTKNQRKKASRKQRREALADACTNGKTLTGGSENESEKNSPTPGIPDTKSVNYQTLRGNLPKVETSPFRSGEIYGQLDRMDSEPSPMPGSLRVKDPIKILKRSPETNAYAVAAAKKLRLMTLLHETFIDDRQYLSNISFTHQISNHTGITEDGIHVFVDASNIMIGFHGALKLSRGQHHSLRMRRQALSFHNLSLILERGRPTAKRIVVGSDNFPSMQEAKAIGYETSILERVHKAKELTPRQKQYTNGNGTALSGGSGSETTAVVQYAPEKWVEQAVDEILHLKMMESVVDASEPSIMVLATGDAAEAEYSGGFLKMVERALAKGWKIELASFSQNTSGAYKRRQFRQKWGERFRIVKLDDFVEVLLGIEQ